MSRALLAFVSLSQASAWDDGAPRYWPKFGGDRSVKTLDGSWEYGVLDRPSDFDSMSPSFSPADAPTPNKTTVPSCMDEAGMGRLGVRGVAFYRTTFEHAGAARLQFQACSFYCRVFVDGKEIGDHRAGGYVAFSLDVPAAASAASSTRSLLVLADNRFNHTTAPMHTGGDFWHFGGLMRSVELHSLPAAGAAPWPWRAYFTPSASDPLASVDLSLSLTDGSYEGPLSVSLAFDGGAAKVHALNASAGRASLLGVKVPGARAWSPASPHLHTAEVGVGGGSVVERFGLRAFGVDRDTARLTINGEALKLTGWNHHTQWPGDGDEEAQKRVTASPTDAQLDADVALLRRGGANFVRGAHYPQDPRWLDRMDEAGFAMWSETLGPGVKVSNTRDAAWRAVQRRQLDEMLDNAMNHAAILTWGWFNEGPSDKEEACPAYAENAEHAATRDPSRFGTWASNHGLNDVCLEHASLVSFNSYPGWYSGVGDLSDPKRTWDKNADGVASGATKSGGAATLGKPFVISETGAGGIFEWDANATDAKWTLTYQTEVIGRDVDAALANEHVSGLTLWHFFDFKTDDSTENNTACDYIPKTFPPNCSYVEINNRPGGENHKGVVDFWRRPKPAFEVVAAKYNASRQMRRAAAAVEEVARA